MPTPMNWRWRLLNHLSSKLPIKKNSDPSAALERLERWSFWATIVIFFGIVLEAWDTIHFAKPSDTISDILSKLLADALVGFGLLAEAVCIVAAIFETRREKAESDEKVAAANTRVAAAKLETERLRAQLITRIIPSEDFLKRLSACKPPQIVRIWFSNDALEGMPVAYQLDAWFKKGNWNSSFEGVLPETDARVNAGIESGAKTKSRIVVMGPWATSLSTISAPLSSVRDAVMEALGDTIGVLQKNVPADEVWVIIRAKA